ncbi:CCDC15, partial [Symbiodinium natans]
VQATACAFAAIRADGSVVTWGDGGCGGDSSAVHDQLQNVQHVQASRCAFAAIRADGSVATWGYGGSGGDSSSVRDQL